MKNLLLVVVFFLISIRVFSQELFYGNEFKKDRNTIVFFHPYMNNENFFKTFAEPLIKDFNIVYLRGGKGENEIYYWFDFDIYSESFINFQQNKQVVLKIDKMLQDFKNVFLVGYSQGGIIANSLMLHNPKKYNQIVSINSFVDTEDFLQLEKLDFSKVKLYFFYGKNDYIISEEMISKAFKLFDKYKIEYKKIPHFNFHQIDEELQKKVIKILKNGRIKN